jgi:amino acid transporter
LTKPVLQSAAAAPPALERALGTRQLAANIVNTIIGSGIFVLPAAVALALGPSAILAYAACAVVVGLIALCFAECGSRVSVSGGPYGYIESAFGPYAGGLAGSFAYFSQAGGSAAVANALLETLGNFWPSLRDPASRVLFFMLMYSGLAALNIRGVRSGARLVEIVTLAKLTPLVLLIVVGAFFVKPQNLGGIATLPTWSDFGAATLLLVFAFTGAEGALTPSGEVRNPSRTVPRAILLALLLVTLIYGSVQIVSQGVLGADLASDPVAPLAATAERFAGAWGRTLLLAGAAVSMFGYITSDALGTPRILCARLLPAALGRVQRRFHTPWVAIIVHAVVPCTLAIGGSFGALALLSVVATLFIYIGCAAATLVLRRRGVRSDGAPFVIPGGPLVPIATATVAIWLLSNATVKEFAAVGVVSALVTALYLARRSLRPDSARSPSAPQA